MALIKCHCLVYIKEIYIKTIYQYKMQIIKKVICLKCLLTLIKEEKYLKKSVLLQEGLLKRRSC